MDEKTKKTILLIGSLFVAVIFVTSYAAFGGNSSTTSTTTAPQSQNTLLVYGSANGTVENYSYTAYITLANRTELDRLNATLDILESNGTISNYIPINGTTYEAILSTLNPYQLSVYLSNSLDSGISVGSYTYVQLPTSLEMHYGTGSQVLIRLPSKNYTVFLSKAFAVGSSVPLQVQALVTTQGTVYNNQIRLSEAQ